MKYLEAKVTFDHPDPSLAADLVAGVFFDFELQGVVIEDPGLEPPADDWAEDAVARPARHAVSGYLPMDERLERRCKILEQALGETADRMGMVWRVSYRELDEQNWAESWKAFFWPQRIGRRIVVKPSWREFEPAPGDLVLDIDPGMAFGTGTHPTTSLCIELIEDHLAPGASLLDVGTGSGILMLAAAKLGAGRVCGGDRDELAVRIAAENLRRNGVPPETVSPGSGPAGPSLPRPLRPRGRQHPDPGHPGADRGHPARADSRGDLRVLRDHRGEPRPGPVPADVRRLRDRGRPGARGMGGDCRRNRFTVTGSGLGTKVHGHVSETHENLPVRRHRSVAAGRRLRS